MAVFLHYYYPTGNMVNDCAKITKGPNSRLFVLKNVVSLDYSLEKVY